MNKTKLGKDLEVGDIFINTAWPIFDTASEIVEFLHTPGWGKVAVFADKDPIVISEDGLYIVKGEIDGS